MKNSLLIYLNSLKRAAILSTLILLLGCESIKLRKEKSDLPFKIEKGDYTFNLYDIDYPTELMQKERFWRNFHRLVKKIVLDSANLNFCLSSSFFDDLIQIKKDGLLEEESIVSKPASELTDDEINTILGLAGKRIELYKGTIQEILNLQIYLIMKILETESNFKEEFEYTELFKARLLDMLTKERTRIIRAINKSNIELVAKIDLAADEKKAKVESEVEYKKYYYIKDLEIITTVNFADRLNKLASKYTEISTLYLYNISKENIIELLASEVGLELKAGYFLLANFNFNGYKQLKNGKIVFLVNGQKETQAFADYKVNIKVIKIEELESLKLEDKFTIRDLFRKIDKEAEEEKKNASTEKAVSKIQENVEVINSVKAKESEMAKDEPAELKEKEVKVEEIKAEIVETLEEDKAN